jgi:hypothetical protein
MRQGAACPGRIKKPVINSKGRAMTNTRFDALQAQIFKALASVPADAWAAYAAMTILICTVLRGNE